MDRVRIKVVRRFRPHALLIEATRRALDSAATKKEAYWWDWLAAILYSSLTIEAIGNTYGEALIPIWKDFESASPIAKIRLCAEHCKINANFQSYPWTTARTLIKFRNRIAHSRPEDISVDETYPAEDCEKHLYTKPQSKLETMVNKDLAYEGYNAINDILRTFADAVPPEKLVEMEDESWHGGAEFFQSPA